MRSPSEGLGVWTMPEFLAWARELPPSHRSEAFDFPVLLIDAPRALVSAADATLPPQAFSGPPRLTREPSPSTDERMLVPLARQVGEAKATISIGRATACDVALPFPMVSKIHARLHRVDSHTWEVEDAGSTHGTLLDGIVLRPGARLALRDGARLSFAEIPVEFRCAQAWRERMLAVLGR